MKQDQGENEKVTWRRATLMESHEKLLKQCHRRACIPEVVPATRRQMGPLREKTRRGGLPGTATKLKITQKKG